MKYEWEYSGILYKEILVQINSIFSWIVLGK